MARPKVITVEQQQEIAQRLLEPDNTIAGIARQIGVSRATLYRFLESHPLDRTVYAMKARGGYWYQRRHRAAR